jgi:hypothetical protein
MEMQGRVLNRDFADYTDLKARDRRLGRIFWSGKMYSVSKCRGGRLGLSGVIRGS